MRTLSLSRARSSLLQLAKEIERDPQRVVGILKRGEPIMTLMSAELYESLLETLEVLSNASDASKLRRALREIERGKGIPWDTARKMLEVRP